ncbi:MAG: acriflavine resistance protein B, partial [Acidobacteria bacterium]
MVAILVSGVVSISLTPMLCSRFLRNPEREEHGKWYRTTERIFDRSRDGYRWSLNKALEHSFATLMVLVATLLLTGFLVAGLLKNGIAKGFLPNEDTGQLFASTEAAQGISFPEMAAHQKQVDKIVADSGYAQTRMSTIGSDGRNSTANAGRIFMRLKPRNTRPSADEIIEKLRPKFAQIPGIAVYMQNLPPIRIGGNLTKSQYQYTLQSPDIAELY